MIFLTIILISFLAWLTKFVRKPKITNLPPEVWRLPVIGSVHWLLSKNMGKLWMEIGKTYGPIAHTNLLGSFEMVLLNGSDTIKEAFKILSLNGRSDNIYKDVLENKGVIWPDDTREQRKFILKNARHFELFGRAAENNIHEEISNLFKHYDSFNGQALPVRHTFNIPTLNVVFHLLCGVKIPHHDPVWKELVQRLIWVTEMPNPFVRICIFVPSFEKWVPSALSGRNFVDKLIKDSFTLLHDYLESHIKSRVSQQPRNFTDALFDKVEETSDENSVFHPSRNYTSPIILDMLIAAIETTSSGLEWSILYLSHYPRVQKKLQLEIDEVIGKDRFPLLSDKLQMPYTQATLQEIFRIAPPIAFGFHMATEDTQFQGYTIKKGSHVIGNFYGVHMDPDIWGNPDEFYPERFIDSNGAFVKTDLLFTFGTGRRACLGESSARDQIFLFISRIFQTYHVLPEKKLDNFLGRMAAGNHCADFKAKFLPR